MIANIPGSEDLPPPKSTIYVLWEEDNGEQKAGVGQLSNTALQMARRTFAMLIMTKKKSHYTLVRGDMHQTQQSFCPHQW